MQVGENSNRKSKVRSRNVLGLGSSEVEFDSSGDVFSEFLDHLQVLGFVGIDVLGWLDFRHYVALDVRVEVPLARNVAEVLALQRVLTADYCTVILLQILE